jgi:uncharacterized lipoprotein YmbA
MVRRLTVVITLCALTTLGAGCGSTAPARFYTLTSTAPPAATASDLSIAVGPVSVPGAVDRPQIVVNTGANRVGVDEFNRWVAPLDGEISRVVAANLAALLGAPRVTQFAQALSADADFRVAIDVQRFESTLGEGALLDAAWAVRGAKTARAETGRTTVREAAPQGGYDALAAAHSRALARLSQDIADAVRALGRAAR